MSLKSPYFFRENYSLASTFYPHFRPLGPHHADIAIPQRVAGVHQKCNPSVLVHSVEEFPSILRRHLVTLTENIEYADHGEATNVVPELAIIAQYFQAHL